MLEPLAITKNSEFLLSYNRASVFHYNSTTKTFKKVDNINNSILSLKPFIQSFISLKALGEEDAKTI